jgi:CRISPR-associated protein Cas1
MVALNGKSKMIKRTICISTPCLLRCQDEQMKIQYNHVKGYEHLPEKSVPIEDIGVLLLEHQQVTITHFLLDRLVQNNTAVITCNDTMHPSGMLLNLEGNTIQSERFRAQIEATEPLKKQLWQQTVQAKINNQAAVLDKWQIKSTYLHTLRRAVKSGDSDNYEAQAAGFYWRSVFPDAWQFFRKREGPPPNNLLNYGYAILRAMVARAIVGSGLLPTLGIFHRNRYNAYCLADDIMEPYRPFVDAIVRQIVDETSAVDVLTKELKAKLLWLPNIDVQMGNDKSPLMVATQRTAASLARCFTGEQRKILYPEFP